MTLFLSVVNRSTTPPWHTPFQHPSLFPHPAFPNPLSQEHYPTLVLVAGALEAVGSLLFISNSKLGSVLLLAFLIPTTVIMHNFWEAPNEQVGKVWVATAAPGKRAARQSVSLGWAQGLEARGC